MISSSIHVMTRRDHFCVLCVINGLHRSRIWTHTEEGMPKNACIHVLSVWNSFELQLTWLSIWIFILVDTSALNVANLAIVVISWQYTNESIQERNRLNVLFVANDLQCQVTWTCTAEFTVARNCSNAKSATRHLISFRIYRLTWESTRERSRTNVHFVIKVLADSATCSHMNVPYTATEDSISVITVECILRRAKDWRFTFIFTLMQSRTPADTAQIVLCGMANSSDICWSHTMKVLGSRVTIVRRNSLHARNWSLTHFNMKRCEAVCLQWLSNAFSYSNPT